MKAIYTLLLIYASAWYCCAQNTGNQLFVQAEVLYEEEQYEASLAAYDTAYQWFLHHQEWNKAAESLIGLGYCLDDLGRQKELLARFEKDLPLLDNTGCIDLKLIGKAWLTMAIAWRNLENWDQSLAYYEKAIAHYHWFRVRGSNVAYAYKNVAQIYMRRINYPKTIACLQNGLEADTGRDYHAFFYAYLAATYMLQGQNDKARAAYQKGFKQDCSEKELATLNSVAGEDYYALKDYEKAARYFYKALDFYLSNGDNENASISYVNLAKVAAAAGQKQQAIRNYEEAIRQMRSFSSSKNREMAKVLVSAGDFYLVEGQLETALAYYQKAMIASFYSFDNNDINANPARKDIALESWAMTSAARKGATLLKIFEKTNELNDLENAAQCFELSLQVHQLLWNTYGYEEAKLNLGNDNFNTYEYAIETNYLLWKYYQKQRYLDRIFQLQEQAKAAVLQEAVQRNKAFLLARVPAYLQDRERELKSVIADVKVALRDPGNLAEGNAISELTSKLDSLESDYHQLMKDIEVLAPEFGRFIESNKNTGIQAFNLSMGKNMIAYFWGAQWVYVLAVKPDGQCLIWRWKNDLAFSRIIDDYLNYFSDSERIAEQPDSFFIAAYRAFQALFPEGLTNMLDFNNNTISDLIIIPDGKLAFIPFDALLTSSYSGNNFGSAPFFIKKYNTHYSWSAALLKANEQRPRKGYKWLHFAPLFEHEDNRGLASLPYSKNETNSAFVFSSFIGKKASLQQLKALAANAEVLHLSTHASANNGEEPRIELFDQPLYLSHLYALRLSADLAVLSACDTHIGEVIKGEGVMSLARGFTYAGVPSVVAGLWKVNEHSTALLFSSFYEYLSKNHTKSVALRNAKIQYLSSNMTNAQKSPYYWAGFVLIGNDNTLSGPGKFENRGMMALSILVLGWLMYKRSQIW